MSDKGKFQAIKGVRDILPPESALWNRVEQTAREMFGTFGFAEIRLPIFEERNCLRARWERNRHRFEGNVPLEDWLAALIDLRKDS